MKMEFSIVIIILVHGLLWGVILGAASTGLTLLWGVMKVVNVAHGEIILLGSYLVIILYSLGLSPYIGLFSSLVTGLIIGLAIYWVLLHKLVGKIEVMTLKTEMSTLLIMFALSIAVSNSYYYFIGSEPKGLGLWHFGPTSNVKASSVVVRTNSILAAFLALILVAVLHLILTKTTLGRAIRAVMQDAQAASLVGINPVKIKMLTTVIAISVTMFSGFLVVLYETAITPMTALIYTPMAFVIVVLGGLGSVVGSLIGGIIIGLVYGLSKAVIASVFNPLASAPLALSAAFILLILVLLFKPEGLFGRR